jgi:hypothetical protein
MHIRINEKKAVKNTTNKLLHSKGRIPQNEETAYRMGEKSVPAMPLIRD